VSAAGADLEHSPLFARHHDAGARLVPFAGWEMPVQYMGVREEHLAVRRDSGVFDVSHMGEIETRGPGARDLLQHLLSNDVDRLAVDGAQYALLCRADGGILDDLFTYRLADERYLTVTNAANHVKDLAHFRREAQAFEGVEVLDRHRDLAMLAVQGPDARGHVARLADDELPARMRTRRLNLEGHPALVCGTGYTGEDGVEIILPPAGVCDVWDRLVDEGVTPCGLAARDTLRLEVCFHLYGNDMDESRDPISAGLGWACREDTGFLGAEAVRAVRERGPDEKLVPFVLTGPGIARHGNPIVGGGVVTSGTLSPSLEMGIGMGYVPAERTEPGTPLEIDVRGKVRAAEVRSKPLYTKET
jgi:glycine cleavage system T protein (aminomethyltransferase)